MPDIEAEGLWVWGHLYSKTLSDIDRDKCMNEKFWFCQTWKQSLFSYYQISLLLLFLFFPRLWIPHIRENTWYLSFWVNKDLVVSPNRFSRNYSCNFQVYFNTHLMMRRLSYSCCQDLRLVDPASEDFKQCFEYNSLHYVLCWFFKFLAWTINRLFSREKLSGINRMMLMKAIEQ